jgi:hypothetical protein
MKAGSRALIVLSLALMLGACASIPLRTMWEMSRMGPEAILAADPAEIRAAVMSDRLFHEIVLHDEARLIVSLRKDDEILNDFEFRMIEQTEAELHRLRSPAGGQTWRVFVMASEEYEQFAIMQHELGVFLEGDEPRQLTLSVNPLPRLESDEASAQPAQEADGEVDPERRTAMERWADEGVPVSIDFQLSAERGYFTLIRNARMPFTFTENDGTAGSG